MKILHVVGARPNFMKAAPVIDALGRREVVQTLVHTGQHYDAAMSGGFFEELQIPQPDVNLNVGSGSHAEQTARIMVLLEPVVIERRPDLVLVYGDVNSTVAAALVCAKLNVPVGHVEAGLRSGDRTMPEEINRLVTDQLASLLFTPSEDADANLLREGADSATIFRVGNVMIDTLIRLLPAADRIWERGKSVEGPYALVTLHRPSNVDDPDQLSSLLRALNAMSRDIRVIFPVHPRTRKQIESLDAGAVGPNVQLLQPLGYIEFLAFQKRATLVITDSGGVQEETTFLGVPCLTVRSNTERPITVSLGTNVLVGQDPDRLLVEGRRVLSGGATRGRIPPLWDGRAADRIATVLAGTGTERINSSKTPIVATAIPHEAQV